MLKKTFPEEPPIKNAKLFFKPVLYVLEHFLELDSKIVFHRK